MSEQVGSSSVEAMRWLLLAVVVVSIGLHGGDVVRQIREARASRGAIQSEDDFYRAAAVVGPEQPLVNEIRATLPTGTPIAVEGDGRFTARRQRFWIALLPDYPVSATAEYAICPAPCAQEGDRLLRRAYEFELVRRGSGLDP